MRHARAAAKTDSGIATLAGRLRFRTIGGQPLVANTHGSKQRRTLSFDQSPPAPQRPAAVLDVTENLILIVYADR